MTSTRSHKDKCRQSKVCTVLPVIVVDVIPSKRAEPWEPSLRSTDITLGNTQGEIKISSARERGRPPNILEGNLSQYQTDEIQEISRHFC
jgi:hypothetical protein